MNEEFVILDAGAVLSPFDVFSPGRVVIRRDTIHAVGTVSDVRAPDHARRIEASHLTITPGFIEPHIHGCGGADVMEATPQAIATISKFLSRHGTTSFLATTVSAPPGVLGQVLVQLASVLDQAYDGARPAGIHLEGPFINVNKRGTHPAVHVQPPDTAILSNWYKASRGKLKLLTIAPELEGASPLAELARQSGIVVGMGHSDASFAEASAAADRGTRYAVHTFNAMRHFSHRDPGILGAVLADDRIYAEIIADGVHVNPEVFPIFSRAKGKQRVVLATDSISATGMPDGNHALGGRMVHVAKGVCRDEEGRLAGSTLTQDVALRNYMLWTRVQLQDAIMAVTVNPATALDLAHGGRIEPGAPADLTLLDKNLQVMKTFVNGKLVFERQS